MTTNERLRVRQVIPGLQTRPGLSYTNLVRQQIIPDLVSLFPPSAIESKRYMPWVYTSQAFATFGIFTEMIVRKFLRTITPVDPGQEPLSDLAPYLFERATEALEDKDCEQAFALATRLTEAMSNYNDITKPWSEKLTETYFLSQMQLGENPQSTFDTEVTRSVGFFENITRRLRYAWPDLGKLQYNRELVSTYVEGHPDIMSDICVLDVKTTVGFKKMAEETVLQILAYYVLAKAENPGQRYAGVVLPLQGTIAYFDLSTWYSWRQYLQVLNETAEKMLVHNLHNHGDGDDDDDCEGTVDEQTYNSLPRHHLLGWHISKGKGIHKSIVAHTHRCLSHYGCVKPCQMFLRATKGKITTKFKPADLEKAQQHISEHKLLFYTHAPYSINLAKPIAGNEWALDALREDLRITHQIGGRGVVIHVGKAKALPVEEALDNMEASIRYCLQDATSSCPLLIETPAGAGTELLTRVEDMETFFTRFSEEELARLSLCIDTCHVFAAGHNPLIYLQQWPREKLTLVHYNDSQKPQGSCVDRHAPMGKGYIGEKVMRQILEWCCDRQTPMIIE